MILVSPDLKEAIRSISGAQEVSINKFPTDKDRIVVSLLWDVILDPRKTISDSVDEKLKEFAADFDAIAKHIARAQIASLKREIEVLRESNIECVFAYEEKLKELEKYKIFYEMNQKH